MNKVHLTKFRSHRATFMTADSGTLKIIGVGDLLINSGLTLKDVLFCPTVSMNLISVSQLCHQGFTINSSKSSTLVMRNRKVILSALLENGLYQFKIAPIAQKALATSSSRTHLFHRRMGHLNLKSLRLLSHLAEGVVLDHDPEEMCETCARSKAHKLPFAPSKSIARNIGDLTHVDLCYIGAEDHLGNITFMILTDDASRYSTLYLLQHKDDSSDCIKSYDRHLFIKTGRHMRILRSDGVVNSSTTL
jgi:hypothetical protein